MIHCAILVGDWWVVEILYSFQGHACLHAAYIVCIYIYNFVVIHMTENAFVYICYICMWIHTHLHSIHSIYSTIDCINTFQKRSSRSASGMVQSQLLRSLLEDCILDGLEGPPPKKLPTRCLNECCTEQLRAVLRPKRRPSPWTQVRSLDLLFLFSSSPTDWRIEEKDFGVHMGRRPQG